MALKSYNELVKLDVAKHCEYRDAKDEQGRKIRVPYLNWAKCIELLHQNGAETVYYTPLRAPDGSYLFSSAAVSNKDGRKTGCWFVSVEIHIDDLTFTMDMPLLNGSIMVYEDTLNQLRISTPCPCLRQGRSDPNRSRFQPLERRKGYRRRRG